MSLETLVELLSTSESTVRRDLDELEAQGRLRRVHGGAEKLPTLQEELTNQQKSIKNVQAKQVLAAYANQLIADGDVIFIDAGTTTDFLISLLDREVTVVTNAIHHAARLVDRGIKTIIIGGDIKHATDACVGATALEQIGRLNFDKAFMGMNGIDDHYLTTPDLAEAAVKSAIIAASRQTYILADSSKLGEVSFVKVAPVSAVTILTTKTDKAILTRLQKETRVIDL